MASSISLTTTIDDIIRRMDKIKVCHDNFKLIELSLTRLKGELNNVDKAFVKIRSKEKITQILKAIEEITISCSEHETDLNGITYNDLQSLLRRLYECLVQYEANMKDDWKMKIQVLSNAYQEQQFFLRTSIDETIRQNLEILQINTDENTINQLSQLRNTHTEPIEFYLRSCIELHRTVRLPDLPHNAINKVACTFYQMSSENQMQTTQNTQTYELPLTCTFTQFEVDKSTSFERNESRRLLKKSESDLARNLNGEQEGSSKGIWQRLISTPYMMSVVEQDDHSKEEYVNAESVIKTKRWIVILGDPGSGKTSFVRRLVHHLAQIFLVTNQHSTDYGLLRIPILISIGEFAKVLNQQPSLTLFDYIGKHKWIDQTIIDNSTISIDNISCALQDYIRCGQALIILDGLDEISVSDQRAKVIDTIENFVENYVQPPAHASTFNNTYLCRIFDDPFKSGGNQLIVTSRSAGYHNAPLFGQFAHYTVRPMDMKYIHDFIDYWFYHVHQHILDTYNLSLVNQGKQHAEGLKKEFEKPENIELINMASNSRLLSFICAISFCQLDDSPLPTQRICLYEQIINAILMLWNSKCSTINSSTIVRIMSDIAFYIHEYSTTNVIGEEEINEVCTQSIIASSGKTLLTEEDVEYSENEALKIARIVREDVGIITPQDELHYGFLHLRFQDYFTCLKLIETDKLKQKKLITTQSNQNSNIRFVVHTLHRHINNPRFCIPIELALNKISLTWSQNDFDDFCIAFIQEQDESNSILPLGAYTLITHVNKFTKHPSNDVIFNTLDCLMIAAGRYKWSIACPFLFDQIAISINKLRRDIITLWLNQFLSKSTSHNIETISALCHLIEGKPHEFENIKWLDRSSCSMLQSLSKLDNETNGFAIDRLLIKIAFTNHEMLQSDPTTLKQFLIEEKIDIKLIPVILFPLIFSLYGGLKRDGQAVVFDPSYIHRESTILTPILKRFLANNNSDKREQSIKKLKRECLQLFRTQIENNNQSPDAVDLCITAVSLCDIEYLQENLKNIPNFLLNFTMYRLKYVSMILRQFYFTNNEDDLTIENETTKYISLAIEKFQYGESARIQFLDLLNSLRSAVARLRSSTTSTLLEGESNSCPHLTLILPNTLRKEDTLLNGLLSTDVRFYPERSSCSLLHHFTQLFWIFENNEEFYTQYRMEAAIESIPEYLQFRNDEDPLCLLTFVPQHLQNLYLRLFIQKFILLNANNIQSDTKQHFYLNHVLVECLMSLSNASCTGSSISSALITLLPWLRLQQLESFGSSLLWTSAVKNSESLIAIETEKQRLTNQENDQYRNPHRDKLRRLYINDEQRTVLIRNYIKQEHERLEQALIENDQGSMKLYSACICLSYICRWTENEQQLQLLQKSVQGAMSITNKLVRLDALCVIAFYSHLNCDKIQVNTGRNLQMEIEYQLNDIHSTLPLLLYATIFIRCLPLLKNRNMIDLCLQNIFDKFGENDQRDQQAVTEALLPYIQFNSTFSSIIKCPTYNLLDKSKIFSYKSSALKKYFNMDTNENLSYSLLISNSYLVELTSDFYQSIKIDDRQISIDETIVTKLFRLDTSVLSEVQALFITNILLFASSTDQSEQVDKLCSILNDALHHVNLIEYKARRLVESWMKWKDSNKLSSFAYHAALLLINSDIWSVEATTIFSDLLCCDNDRFRHRSEIICRSPDTINVRTGSKLGIDVLLTLVKIYAHFELSSATARLHLNRMLRNITLDVQSHLETLLWLERYRIHALVNKNYSFNASGSWPNPLIPSYFSIDIKLDACSYIDIFRLTGDLATYLCDMIPGNFISFLEIDGDGTSNQVRESHKHFIVSVITKLNWIFDNDYNTSKIAFKALSYLLDTSKSDRIRQAAAYALGYVCNARGYKNLFEKVQIQMGIALSDMCTSSNPVLTALIASYCYSVSVNKIPLDQDDIDLFCTLFQNSSGDVLQAIRAGFGRALPDPSFLYQMLLCDRMNCYHALIGSSACLLITSDQEDRENLVAEFIKQHPALLSIFVTELFNSIRHFTNDILPFGNVDYYLAYGYPQYVKIASLIASQMPTMFCAYINDWPDGDKFKQALFYTSKQHNYPQRAACLNILSLFGELTVELCEMFIQALYDDPYIQNTSYNCLTRINSIKDKRAVLNRVLSYLKVKSMNVRYMAAKILLQLSKSSLIPFKELLSIFYDLIQDPDSMENLWLIRKQDNIAAECVYDCVGPLKDVIYSLLVQYLTGNTYTDTEQNKLKNIDLDFILSEKASHFASCSYETNIDEQAQIEVPLPPFNWPSIDTYSISSGSGVDNDFFD